MGMTIGVPELPKTWLQARTVIAALGAAIVATVSTLAWAGSQVRAVAIEQATQAANRVADDLATHKAVEQLRHEYEDKHLESIDNTLKEISAKLSKQR